jgi:excisionase family DNA binding protein
VIRRQSLESGRRSMQEIIVSTIRRSGGELPPLMTINQLAKLLQCSTRTVARMRRAGHVPRPVKIGGALRWRADDVREWIEEGCNPIR